jgi:hypothetical protein
MRRRMVSGVVLLMLSDWFQRLSLQSMFRTMSSQFGVVDETLKMIVRRQGDT